MRAAVAAGSPAGYLVPLARLYVVPSVVAISVPSWAKMCSCGSVGPDGSHGTGSERKTSRWFRARTERISCAASAAWRSASSSILRLASALGRIGGLAAAWAVWVSGTARRFPFMTILTADVGRAWRSGRSGKHLFLIAAMGFACRPDRRGVHGSWRILVLALWIPLIPSGQFRLPCLAAETPGRGGGYCHMNRK